MTPRLGRTIVGLAVLWGILLAARVATIPYLWDDEAFLERGLRPSAAEGLGVAWTADFWQLAEASRRAATGMYRPVVGSWYVLPVNPEASIPSGTSGAWPTSDTDARANGPGARRTNSSSSPRTATFSKSTAPRSVSAALQRASSTT